MLIHKGPALEARRRLRRSPLLFLRWKREGSPRAVVRQEIASSYEPGLGLAMALGCLSSYPGCLPPEREASGVLNKSNC